MAAIILSILLQTIKWRALLPDEEVSLTRLYLVRNAGQSLKVALPVRGAGEAAELAMLANGGTVAVSILMHRALDLMVTTSILAVGNYWIPEPSVFQANNYRDRGPDYGTVSLFLFSDRISRVRLLGRLGLVRAAFESVGLWRNRRRRLALSLVFAIAS